MGLLHLNSFRGLRGGLITRLFPPPHRYDGWRKILLLLLWPGLLSNGLPLLHRRYLKMNASSYIFFLIGDILCFCFPTFVTKNNIHYLKEQNGWSQALYRQFVKFVCLQMEKAYWLADDQKAPGLLRYIAKGPRLRLGHVNVGTSALRDWEVSGRSSGMVGWTAFVLLSLHF